MRYIQQSLQFLCIFDLSLGKHAYLLQYQLSLTILLRLIITIINSDWSMSTWLKWHLRGAWWQKCLKVWRIKVASIIASMQCALCTHSVFDREDLLSFPVYSIVMQNMQMGLSQSTNLSNKCTVNRDMNLSDDYTHSRNFTANILLLMHTFMGCLLVCHKDQETDLLKCMQLCDTSYFFNAKYMQNQKWFKQTAINYNAPKTADFLISAEIFMCSPFCTNNTYFWYSDFLKSIMSALS